ncbi:MAG: putative toxin-antitoxin system toxin component, PIN family [Thermoplasmata archaeon]|nr:putative toxin-antitoxin system toxin component, PIN family [Thermoplasmata archaeon]
MKVVLDTNQLVSAFFWNGNEREVLEKCRTKELDLLISPEILGELDAVLERKFSVPEDKRAEYSKNIILVSRLVFPNKMIDAIKTDLTDNRILECAVDGEADYIVSGDKHLLGLKEYEGIKILKAKEFLSVYPDH